jgi:hypothetical protein
MADGIERPEYADATISASVQQATPAEIAALPEGARSKNVVKVYSATEIRCEGTAQDIIIAGGRSYRAVKIERWLEQGYVVAYCEEFSA